MRGIQVFFQEVNPNWNFLDRSMVDDMADARDISGRAEGPTANLTEAKNDENLW